MLQITLGLTAGVAHLLKANKCDYIKGWATLTGKTSISVKGTDGTDSTLEAKNIIVATGSVASGFPGIEIDEKVIVSSTGMFLYFEFQLVDWHLVYRSANSPVMYRP